MLSLRIKIRILFQMQNYHYLFGKYVVSNRKRAFKQYKYQYQVIKEN